MCSNLVFVEVFTYFIYSLRCHLCVWLYFVVWVVIVFLFDTVSQGVVESSSSSGGCIIIDHWGLC